MCMYKTRRGIGKTAPLRNVCADIAGIEAYLSRERESTSWCRLGDLWGLARATTSNPYTSARWAFLFFQPANPRDSGRLYRDLVNQLFSLFDTLMYIPVRIIYMYNKSMKRNDAVGLNEIFGLLILIGGSCAVYVYTLSGLLMKKEREKLNRSFLLANERRAYYIDLFPGSLSFFRHTACLIAPRRSWNV